MRFLGDSEEFATVILAEFHVETLSLDLQLPRLDEIIHFCKNGGVYSVRLVQWKQIFRRK